MSSDQSMESNPGHGHLGTSWEIAIVVVFVCLAIALVGAFIFQIRRKRNEKRRQAEQQALDAERGQRRRTRGKSRVKHPASAHSKDSEKRGESCTCLSGTVIEEPKSDVEAAAPAEGVRELTKPPPAAQSTRHSKTSYHEYIAKHPPKYYWDQR